MSRCFESKPLSCLFREPHWRCRKRVRFDWIPRDLRTWLYSDESLTARLMRGCRGQFRVDLLGQRYVRAQRNEAQVLAARVSQYVLLREVFLYCNASCCVYARSVIPLSTLTGRQRRLAYLGNRSLGGFLFSCPDMRRDEVELARIEPGHLIYNAAIGGMADRPEVLWGRRSVFRLHNKPLLVTEIFLPTINAMVP